MSCKVVLFLFLASSEPYWAQPTKAADSLVAEAAFFARSGISWKAQGTTIAKGADGKRSSEQFRIAYQLSAAIRARLEITSGVNRFLRVCDGESQWTYYPSNNTYIRVILPQMSECVDPLTFWPLLPITLRSPVEAGTDRITFDGRPRDCQIVRGTFHASDNDPSRRVLTLCIDPVTRLIFRFQMEETSPRPGVQATTFSSIQRDVTLDPDLFVFRPPAGSTQVAVINWLDPIAQPSNVAFRVSNEVTAPLLVSMVAPESAEAAAGSPNGAVVLFAEVNDDGIPQNIQVIRALGVGLDEKAVEAVKKWRFKPGVREGKPVTVVTALAVSFRAP